MESRPLIALVEDEKDLLAAYSQIFKDLGEVVCFSDPAEFVTRFINDKAFRPSLVVTDFAMPGMTALQMLTKVKAAGAEFLSILVSGYLDKDTCISANNLGVRRILEKPVRRAQIMDAAHQVLAEVRIAEVRAEIRNVMGQLSEIFSMLRMICATELKLDQMIEPTLLGEDGDGEMVSMDTALAQLEKRLEQLNIDEQNLIRSAA